MRVRIVKPWKQCKPGDVIEVGESEGHDLLNYGIAILSKDMTQTDYKTKGVKRRGNSRILRTNNLSRR